MENTYTLVDRPDHTTEIYAGKRSDSECYAGTLQNEAERERMIAKSAAAGDTLLFAADRDEDGRPAVFEAWYYDARGEYDGCCGHQHLDAQAAEKCAHGAPLTTKVRACAPVEVPA